MQRRCVKYKWAGKKGHRSIKWLIWSKCILFSTKKPIFYTAVENILSYDCDTWSVKYRLEEKLLSTNIDFWRKAAWTSRLLKVGKEEITEKTEAAQTLLERTGHNTLKLYGHIARMGDSRWPELILTCLWKEEKENDYVGIGSGRNDETEESNNWKHSNPANMVPVTGLC